MLYHCRVTLLLSCGLTLLCCLVTHAAAWPLMVLLSPCHNALPFMLQPVSRYDIIVLLLASVALLFRCHATLPAVYLFTTVMLLACFMLPSTVMLLCQKGCLPVSCYFARHCHAARHCLGTWPLTVHAMFVYRDFLPPDSSFIWIFLLIKGHTSLLKFMQVYTCNLDGVILLCCCHTALPLSW